MKNIKEAIIVEQQYLKDRELGKDYSLVEALKTSGYNQLLDYFNDKREYQIQELHLKEYFSNVDNCLEILFDLVKKEEPSVLIVPSDKVFVYHGDENYNQQFCIDNNIPVYEVGHHGGNIVGGPKDISIGIILPKYVDVNNDWFLQGFQKIFQLNNQKVTPDNNDLIWNGSKVMGGALMTFENVQLYVCNFSFSDSSYYIEQICNVSREKTPGFLSCNMVREDLQRGVEQWLKL